MSDERCGVGQNADIVGRLKELEDDEREVARDCDCPAEYTANWRHAETASYASALISSLRSDLAAAKEREAELVSIVRRFVALQGSAWNIDKHAFEELSLICKARSLIASIDGDAQ